MDELRPALRLALGRLSLPIVVFAVLVAAFLLLPILVILPLAFTRSEFLRFPPPLFSLRWMEVVLGRQVWTDAILVSLQTATVGALIATVTGTAAAFALRRIGRGSRLLRTLLLAPIVIPQLVLALGLYIAFREVGLQSDLRILVLGQATVAMPLVFVAVSAGLSTVDPNLSRAAAGLGFRWPSVVLRVELPLVARSVTGAAILAFALCFDEAVLAFFLSPPGQETLPTRIWLSASESASPSIAAASTLVLAVAVTLLAIVTVVLGTRGGTAPAPVSAATLVEAAAE